MKFTGDDGDIIEMVDVDTSVLTTNAEVVGYMTEALKKVPAEAVDRVMAIMEQHSKFVIDLSLQLTRKKAEVKSIKSKG